ncbi:hypothetical protein TVAG_044550 [Trichomonas vaginalis G3]|uniref:Glycosyltransferase 61 catalytic domain-containing protein n=1 Tax=Trichomonas vaginalis (strain ATCC PRA-98 / G3) TaxID=412133 RepID=A2EY27_TRIV3|nr:glycosyltransferase family [Trichomonas vaginalis G3]EAY02437.1 hypothetical protein TVAG_044550 [Trichomonas vaginalis G3]KAI5527869.1 glycosyltransferase family [Trichomonas vaginalis G3]|eukprot:XP_001330677.1 hypothetical protein [Trichomonas vaginalis G3]
MIGQFCIPVYQLINSKISVERKVNVESEWIESINDENFTEFLWKNEEWVNMTDSYYWTDRPEKREAVPVPMENIFRARGKSFTFENCYANSNGVVTEKGISLQYDYSPNKPKFQITVMGELPNAVIARKYWNTYGHAIHDLLVMLVTYPESVLNSTYYVIHNWEQPLMQTHLIALGLGHMTPVLEYQKYYQVGKLYYNHPKERAHELFAFGLPNLHKRYRKYMNLSVITPTKYRVINRRPNERRYFTNINELISNLSKKFPNIEFTEMFLQNTLTANAKQFAECKFVIGSGGSLLYNCMFMDKHAGIVILFGHLIDFPNLVLFGLIHMYSGGITHINVNHHDGRGPCHIPETVAMTEKIFYAMEHHKYPYMKNLFPSFNYSIMFHKRMNGDYTKGLGWTNEEDIIP